MKIRLSYISKTTVFLTGLLVVFIFAACGSDNPPASDSGQQGESSNNPTPPPITGTVEMLNAEEVLRRADEAFSTERSFRLDALFGGDGFFGQGFSGEMSMDITWPDELVGEDILPERAYSLVQTSGFFNSHEEEIFIDGVHFTRCGPDELWREVLAGEFENTLSGADELTVTDFFNVSEVEEVGPLKVEVENFEGQSVYVLTAIDEDSDESGERTEIIVRISAATFLPLNMQSNMTGPDGESQTTSITFEVLDGPIDVELPDESMIGEPIDDPFFSCESEPLFGGDFEFPDPEAEAEERRRARADREEADDGNSSGEKEAAQVTEEILASSVDGVLFDLTLSGSLADSDGDRSFRDDIEFLSPGSVEFQGHFPSPVGDLVIVSCFAPECQEGDGPVTFEVRYWTTDPSVSAEQPRQRSRR